MVLKCSTCNAMRCSGPAEPRAPIHGDRGVLNFRVQRDDRQAIAGGVQVVQRWILAELNQAIRELVDDLNVRPMRGWGTTRRALLTNNSIGPHCESCRRRLQNSRPTC